MAIFLLADESEVRCTGAAFLTAIQSRRRRSTASMKLEEVPAFTGLGLDSKRHIEALSSTRKHFPKDHIQKATLSSGLSIEYTIESSAETENLPEERLVLINGFMTPKEGWAPIIDFLLEKWGAKKQSKTLKILSFDNRGAGGSSAPMVRYTTSMLAQDTLNLMSSVGWESAHIVGGSMGGMIALEVAAIAPQRVRSLTLLVTARGKYKPSPRMWRALFGSIFQGSMQCVMHLLYPSAILDNPIEGRDDLTVRDVLMNYHSTPLSDKRLPPLYAVAAQGLANLTHYVSDERLARIAQSSFPICIIGSKQDILMPPKHFLELLERLKGDQVQAVLFETGGHGAPIQFMEEIAGNIVQTINRASP